MLCCVVLRCVVLCYAVMGCVELCYVVLCCAVLRCAVVRCSVVCFQKHFLLVVQIVCLTLHRKQEVLCIRDKPGKNNDVLMIARKRVLGLI